MANSIEPLRQGDLPDMDKSFWRVAMAIYIPLILYINLKYLPKSAQPGVVNIFFVSCGTLVYASFAVYLVWDKIASWLGA